MILCRKVVTVAIITGSVSPCWSVLSFQDVSPSDVCLDIIHTQLKVSVGK